jgi:hypothetical protein
MQRATARTQETLFLSARTETLLRQAAASQEQRGALIKTTHQQLNLLYGAIKFSISLQLYAVHTPLRRAMPPPSVSQKFLPENL